MGDNRAKVILALIYFLITAALGVGFLLGVTGLYEQGVENYIRRYHNETNADLYTPPKYAYRAISLFVTIATFCFGLGVLIRTKQKSFKKCAELLLSKSVVLVYHSAFMYVLMLMIELFLEVSQPNFLGYKKIFCTVNGKPPAIPTSATKYDQLCQTFPSYFCALMSFCIFYMGSHLKHYDYSLLFHRAQQPMAVVMHVACFVVFVTLYNDGQLYLADIGLGALFGAIYAVSAVQDLYYGMGRMCIDN